MLLSEFRRRLLRPVENLGAGPLRTSFNVRSISPAEKAPPMLVMAITWILTRTREGVLIDLTKTDGFTYGEALPVRRKIPRLWRPPGEQQMRLWISFQGG